MEKLRYSFWSYFIQKMRIKMRASEEKLKAIKSAMDQKWGSRLDLTGQPVWLPNISSVNLGLITPFEGLPECWSAWDFPIPGQLMCWQKQINRSKNNLPRILKRLKKLLNDEIQHILFANESMIRDYQAIHQTWFERGKQRIIKTYGKHRGVKLVGYLNYETGEVYCEEHERYDAEMFFTKQFLKSEKMSKPFSSP